MYGLAALATISGALAKPGAAQDRHIVDATAPLEQAVTIYRDPNRGPGEGMQRGWPRGFAMISETRQVDLPPGRSTLRFEGVAEGMIAVSAIVTGLPGGTIEKNRNADLLSPGALVNGLLGNRIRITRTNPATGEAVSEPAVVRTRADGGLVLQTDSGFEAVRCAGLPEKLSFDRVPDGLSSQPVFTVDTFDANGGTYTVTLSYLAWGFDWEANYVATVHEGGRGDDLRFDLRSWLTVLNDNGQSFENAELLVIAGTLNVVSDYEALADPPEAGPLRLTCYPLGSTARGSPIRVQVPPPLPAPSRDHAYAMRNAEMAEDMAMAITVTGAKVVAGEEDLGDLKLYRVPGRVTVAAKSLKQVAFLERSAVEGSLFYTSLCAPRYESPEWRAAPMLLETTNEADQGLGAALPSGSVAIFERGPAGELLVAQETIRDYAEGQDVELALGDSAQVFMRCQRRGKGDGEDGHALMRAQLRNANPRPAIIRLYLGNPAELHISGIRTARKKGQYMAEIRIPANGSRSLVWQARRVWED